MNMISKNIKSITLLFAFFMTMVSGLPAQQASPEKDRIKQKIRTHKIAFITDRLSLSEKEAEKFWPIYREYENEKKALREERIFKNWKDEMTDQEADKMLENIMDIKSKDLEIEKKYVSKFKQVISTKKIMQLYKAERDFKSKMVEYIKGKPRKRSR